MRRFRTALITNSLLLRLRCAWHALRGRPTLYKLNIQGGRLILAKGTLVASFMVRETVIVTSERPDDMQFIGVEFGAMDGTSFQEPGA